MASLKSLVKFDTNRGLFGNAVKGLGVGTLVNVGDKKFAQGKLTSMGVNLGQNINGKPVTLNLTDALTWFVVSGMKLKLNPKELITVLATIGVKKYFELMDYIDPADRTMDPDNPNATNVTMRKELEDMKMQLQQAQGQHAASFDGGLTHN